MKLNNKDLEYFKLKKLSEEDIKYQVYLLKKGTKFLDLARPARLMDGIIHFDSKTIKSLESRYTELIANKSITKFIPASGSATRMFKDLYSFLIDKKETEFINQFISNLNKFAFYDGLKLTLETKGLILESLIKQKDYRTIIEFFL